MALQQNGIAVEDQLIFDADPRTTPATASPDEPIYNLGESTNTGWGLTNARGESLSRSLTLVLKDSAATQKASSAETGPAYSLAYTLQAGDDAADDLTGKQYTIHCTPPGQTTEHSANAINASTYSAIHSGTALPTPGDPTSADGTVTPTRPGAASNVILNHGQSVTLTGSLWGVRGQAWPFASNTIDIINAAEGSDVSTALTVAGDGSFSYVYSPPLAGGHPPGALSVGGTPATDAKHAHITPAHGNAVRDSADVVTLHNGLTLAIWTGKSNTDADADGNPDLEDKDNFFVGADVCYTKPRVTDAAADPYDDALIDAATIQGGVVEETKTGAQSQTESGFDGWADLFFAFQVVAPAGARTLRYDAARGGNGARLEEQITYDPSYTGNLELVPIAGELVGGAAGTVRVFCIPRIIETSGGQNVPRLLSEATPAATLDDQPRYVVWTFDGTDPPTKTTATAATQTGGNDDVWHADVTIEIGKAKVVEWMATINGGQATDRVPLPGARNVDALQFLDSGEVANL